MATETEGPFPTHTPASYVRADIAAGRAGYQLTVKINGTNGTSSCAAVSGALVDIWHCDAGGNYSEYGGTGMQSTSYTSVHFLRGRQTTDSSGLVTFTSLFPGWYSGRATHIHVHIYTASGTSLKVNQIAFPEYRLGPGGRGRLRQGPDQLHVQARATTCSATILPARSLPPSRATLPMASCSRLRYQ